MKINRLEKIDINNTEQWVLVRGKSADAPLLIHVQAGPGLPIIPEANTMERLLHLENHYLVAYWDQRGCGKSFSPKIDVTSINISQLSRDIVTCTEYLTKSYGKSSTAIVGYSIGATASLMAAVGHSDLFNILFLVGTDVDVPAANAYAIEFAMKRARERNNRKMIKSLEELRSVPMIDAKKFQQRAKILTDLGGIKVGSNYAQLVLSSIKNMLLCNSYTIGDIVKTIKGMEYCQNALLKELDSLNLFNIISKVDVSVHFLHGKHDVVSPLDIAVSFYNHLLAEQKEFTTFEHSAHFPHYEESEKFSNLLIEQASSGDISVRNNEAAP
jgi:pimeloyl-ACP methyl ester carboxylesterase